MRHLSVSPVPNLGKKTRSPQSDLTSWILTLPRQVLAVKRQRMRIFILLSLDSSKISLSIDFFTENEKRESVSSEIIDTKLNTKNAKLLVIKTSHDNSFKKNTSVGFDWCFDTTLVFFFEMKNFSFSKKFTSVELSTCNFF